jgi:hypothetical protein
MGSPDRSGPLAVAAECVSLVAEIFGHELDYSLESLVTLDQVCANLVADGPLSGKRLNLWSHLAGAYTGEVCLRAYGGEWIEDDGATAISISGLTGYPFNTAYRVLSGEEFKSLASFARSIPALIEHSRRNNPT